MSNLIVRAEKEVILATNYWQNSVASKYITNAMKELSRRAGERGEKIVFKLEYDRGSAKQLLDSHYVVPEKEYLGKAVALPRPDEIPHLDIQVINYHKPMLGTFHCKYMIVDRKYAVLQSNNIQDNDNLEMMTHLEGPIVDSLYDMALISWHKKLEPALPSHNSPAVQGGVGSFGNRSHDEIFDQDGSLRGHSAIVHPERMKEQKAYSYESRAINQPGVIPPQTTNDGTNSADILTGPSTTDSVTRPMGVSQAPETGVNEAAQEVGQRQGNVQPLPESTQHGFENKDLGRIEMLRENAKAAATSGDMEHIVHTRRGDKKTTPDDPTDGSANADQSATATIGIHGPDAKTQGFLSAGEATIPQSQIEHPSPAKKPLPEHTADDPHYDDDIAAEVARVQTAVSPREGETRVQAVTRHLNHTKNVDFKGDAPEYAPHEEMTPYIPHPVHEPFPIAMVCREPHGTPNHNSVYNPQNEVWLSALRNAKQNVFIQSPTLNAEPLIPAIIEACERGIDVYCYICLGYNDTVSQSSAAHKNRY
jgi:phosphatidylserine/phosphatidylglycerophosphate/cardiolipin synthase-like enzyme